MSLNFPGWIRCRSNNELKVPALWWAQQVVGVIASPELSVRSGKEGTHQSGSVWSYWAPRPAPRVCWGRMGMQILPQVASALILSPTLQPPAGLRCQCIPEMDPHNRRGWGVGVSPLPWSWRDSRHAQVEFTKGSLDKGIRVVTSTINVSSSISQL